MKKLNRKGDMMIDILIMLLLLILFFAVVESVQVIVNEATAFTSDTTVLWMLRAFTFFILIGIFRYVLQLGGTQQ